MNPRQAPATRRVDIVIYPGFQSLEAVGPLAVFDHANALLLRSGRPRGYEVAFASDRLGPVCSDSIVSLEATRLLAADDLPDVALVVGTRGIEEALSRGASLVAWLRASGPRVPRLASLCSGSFFLAEAGLLDGKRATTHWNEARAMQARYPQVEVDAQPIFVREGNLFTSAGVTSGIDLALAIVEEDFGREVALSVASKLIVYLKRPGGQSQLSMHLASQMSRDPALRELQEWILESLDQPLHPERLAAKAQLSPTELEARFIAHSGVRPHEFVENARFELACALIEDSGVPLSIVAMRSGLADVERMNEVFVQRLGVDAEDHRQRFERRQQVARRANQES
jgi:transcriptional regulator GlxA family with amidase domain